MKRIITIILAILFGASFLGTGYFLYKKSESPDIIYETETPFYTDIIKKTVATGTIMPRKEIELKSQVSGVVEELYVEAGDKVTNNQKIAKIKIIPNVIAVNNAKMRLETARINFQNTKTELDRQSQLYQDKVISQFDYNKYVLQYNLAKQEVEAAENNLELVQEGASKKSGEVSNIVYSTADGIILDVPVKEGTFVIETNTFNDGTTIASVANMNEMIFEGKVDESEVGKIREGMDLKLQIGALENENIRAKLEYISPKGKAEEGAIQFEIRAAIELDKKLFLRAGYSANADIVLEKKDSVLAIKERNLIFENGHTYIEVEKGDQEFEKAEIKTGLSDGINIEVLEGVTETTRIKKR